MTAHTRDLPEFLSERARPATGQPSRSALPVDGRRVPGEPGLWIFILGDMLLFGMFFLAFVIQMSERRGEWAESASRLHSELGMANTIVLLVSSFLVARSVSAWQSGLRRRAGVLMLSAAASGVCFAAVKISEYVLLLGEGVTPTENLFFTYYFVLTGIHLLHVGIGVVILLICAQRMERNSLLALEGSGSYWHMVDVLWVVLFPLLYMVGRV